MTFTRNSIFKNNLLPESDSIPKNGETTTEEYKIFDDRACVMCSLRGKRKVPWEYQGYLPDEKIIKTIREKGCDILFVGEAPGHYEEKEGRPFIHKAGALLRETIAKLKERPKFKDFRIFITNACKCKPTNQNGDIRPPTIKEINSCKVNLKREIELAKPKIIVALGRSACQALGVPSSSLEKLRGNIFQTHLGKVFVTYHPSAIVRNHYKNVKIFESDLENAFILASEGQNHNNSNNKKSCKIITSVALPYEKFKKEVELFLREKPRVIAIDYETVPIDWNLFPKEVKTLNDCGLTANHSSSDICLCAIAYTIKKENYTEIRSFSFPINLTSHIERLINYTKKLREKITSLITNNDKLNFETDSGLLSLYDLYTDYKLSRETIDEIYNILTENNTNISLSKRKIKEILRSITQKLNDFQNILEKKKEEVKAIPEIEKAESEGKNFLRTILSDEKIKKVIQNPQFELAFSICKLGVEPKNFIGTDTLDYLLGNVSSQKLSELEKKYILPIIDKIDGYIAKEESKKKINTLEEYANYNALDSAKTLLIYHLENKKIKSLENIKISNSYKEEISLPFAIESAAEFLEKIIYPFAVYSHLNGLKIDIEKTKELAKRIHSMISILKEKIREIVGADNIREDEFKEKVYSLYEGEPILTPKGEKSLSEEALKTIYKNTHNQELKKAILYIHSVLKYEGLLSRYIEKFPFYLNDETLRIHPIYNVTKTTSGRLSCRDPNIQQVPREPFKSCVNCFSVPFDKEENCPICGGQLEVIIDFREVFIPEKGNKLVMADYSQIEMVVLAELSKDSELLNVINNGFDMHSYNAGKIYNIPYEEIVKQKDTNPEIAKLRQNAKRVTFGVIYGASEEGLALRSNISKEEAEKIVSTFFKTYPATQIWIKERHKEVINKGVVLVPTGRPRWFPQRSTLNINASSLDDLIANFHDKVLLRQAQNTPIQGFASDLNLVTCEILRRIFNVKVLGAIHDSIICEIKEEEEEEIIEKIETAKELTIRLKETLSLLNLVKTPQIIENLSVKLKIEPKVGYSWNEIK
ncbi:MAG: DNA polymerase [Candidatus Aenigmatarchaeota archaeon]